MDSRPTETSAVNTDRYVQMEAVLQRAYALAEQVVKDESRAALTHIPTSLAAKVEQLSDLKNAARGIALTLIAYGLVDQNQDVRRHKAEILGGFSARSFDSRVTVPFLIEKQLPRSVESHWLSQTFSFAPSYDRGLVLKTVPKAAGPLLVEVLNDLQETEQAVRTEAITIILERLIRIRNANQVILTRPKDLPIYAVRELIERHLSRHYQSNAPRLPQLVIYAVYQSMVKHIGRYAGTSLETLERLKSADRKRGTIADIVVEREGTRIEAVEIKHDQPIQHIHVLEAIDKVRAESVTRYYLLSNQGIDTADRDQIRATADRFLKQNGCEIIVNGLTQSLNYYLRLLPDTKEFLFNYAELVEADPDTAYEHRIAWNEECDKL